MGLIYDENVHVHVDSDTGEVYDAEDGTFLGYVADDPTYGDSDLSSHDVNAIYEAAALDHKLQLADLKDEIAAFREEQAAARGYSLAREEDAEAEYALEQAETAYADALQQLADKLGRPISDTEATEIGDRLPAEYDLSDIERAASDVGVRPFHGSGSNGGGRGARARYIEDRLREVDADSADLPDAEAGGLSGWYERLQQATGDPNGR